MKLSDVIVLNKKFARSINLERDKSELDVLNNYQVTAKAQEVMERFIAALGDEKVTAWSLVGPYGMGKSAFLNFLLAVTGPQTSSLTQTALHKLKLSNQELYDRFLEKKEQITGEAGFFRVPIVASFESMNTTLARGLQSAVSQSELKNKDKIRTNIDEMLQNGSIEPNELLTLFKAVAKLAETPLVIVIDELGKNLEYLSYHCHNGDLFILQQLAEMNNVYLWVCLHQAFDEYMSGFSAVQQQEWNKVQGRFEEISFIESTAQMLNLIKTILNHNFKEDLQKRVKEWEMRIKESLENISVAGKEYLDVDSMVRLYPLHPLTSLALIELCRRFAQNERTLVSFLSSGHMYALPAQIERMYFDPDKRLPAVGLDCLYDYFFQFSHTSLANRPATQRWVEINDIIQSADQFSEEESVLLKNIGILNLLAGSLVLKASFEVIASIMEYSYLWAPEKVKKILDFLDQRGVIFYRDYAGEFRLWEGSDFDVSGAIDKEKSKLSLGSLEEILEANLPLSPIIAARYAHQKGIMRRFERRWLDVESLSDKLAPQKGFDGLLIYCYGTQKEPGKVPKVCSDGRPILVAHAPVKETLSEIALEIVACQRVLENYHQLTHDKVARKEVNFRLRVSQDRFREYLARAFAPGAAGLLWYTEGEKCQILSRRELSVKISELCQAYYKYAPTIKNEIISSEKLSSAAVRARRKLVEAMATRAEEENLGFTGWGPEVAIYKSLLLAKGLHIKNKKTGTWQLTLEGTDPNLNKAWEELDQLLEKTDDQGVSVAAMLDRLREIPFGLKQGPALIYISLYLLVNAENLTVFREGAYHPYLSAADMALLLKRPELFTVKKFITNGMQEKVFAAYKAVLKKSQIKTDPNLRNATMLGVLGPLMKFVDQLPRYSKQTRNISMRSQRVRSVIANAVDPLSFLFEDLPKALGIDIDGKSADTWVEDLENSLRSTLSELGQAYERLNKRIQETLLKSFPSLSLEQLCSSQRTIAQNLITICDATDLKPVLQAMARDESNVEDWVRGIAGAVVKKPVDAWKDQDLAVFEAKLADYAERIKQLETLATAHDLPIENVQMISVMKSDGNIKREVVRIDNSDPEVERILEQILALPQEKSRAVLALLADKIMLGG